jgi:glycosyltransferase involved in cell wall biosynthesis
MKLHSVQGVYCTGGGVSYTCLSLMDQMSKSMESAYWAYDFAPTARRSYSRTAIPSMLFRLSSRLPIKDSTYYRMLEAAVLRNISCGDIAWIWPPSSESMYSRLSKAGALLVTERINTCIRLYRRRVTAAYKDLDWRSPHNWADGDQKVQTETAIVQRSDAVFAPNRFVRESLLEIGYPEHQILDTSYGWCPDRMAPSDAPAVSRTSRPRFLFVGSGSVRKGLPHLLRAWKDAAVDAELVIAGRLDGNVAEGCRNLLSQPGVVQMGFVQRIADVYRSADVFAFPTHEEGGPQVTFEAAACGLALLVSDMGTAGAFRDGIDATVIDPLNHDGWVEQIRQLARDDSHRAKMQQAACARAADYTWNKVAARRLAMLQTLVGARRD